MRRMMVRMLWIGLLAGALASPPANAAEPPPVEVFAKPSPFSLLRPSPDGEHLAANAAYAVPHEGHGFYKDENNVAFYRRLEVFLARNLAVSGTAAVPVAGMQLP